VTWWSEKSRQAVRHATGSVTKRERLELQDWLSPDQSVLFDTMHPADQRHGLDVVAHLRADGHEDDIELLLAGLLHDCSKGPDTGLLHRVAWSLGERYGEGVIGVSARLPGFAAAFERLRDHAEDSAVLARAAGCSERTTELIRYQSEPRDADAGAALQRADEAA